VESFDPIPGVTGVIRPDGRELIVSGTPRVLDEVRSLLTVDNMAVQFRIKQIKKTLARGCRYESKLKQELKELESKAIVEYYADLPNGDLSCPPGLWWLCSNLSGHKGEIPYTALPPDANGRSPRDYQIEACQALLQHKRASISLTTGAGKTMLTCLLVHCAVSVGKRVMVVVPTIELTNQTYAALRVYFGDNVAAIGGANKWKPGKWVYVTTIQSACHAIDVQDVVVIDEAHHSSASSYEAALMSATQAEYVYGMTASPCRADGLVLGIHAHCGPVVYARDAAWGVASGWLCPASINEIAITGLGSLDQNNVLAQKAYSKLCSHKKTLETLHKLILMAKGKNLKTLVLYKTEGAGSILAEYLTERGIPAKAACAAFRKPLVDFRNGTTDLLISNAPLCGEGVDIPGIDCIIDVTQVASESQTRQILGRGLRPAPGKTRLLFFSIVLHGYGTWRYSNGERYWHDVYAGYGEFRKNIYREICPDVKEKSV
jgi:superfamily II DNA or RNA helicase